MKFGVRECADVVLRAKSAQKIGKKIFYKNEPVCYFDTLKTSTFEGAATTVYAQGGRGNARLMSWDGERTVTFTMEDALISPIGLSILTGAGLIEATATTPVIQHVAETTTYFDFSGETPTVYVDQKPVRSANDADDPTIYVMVLDDHGEVVSEPYLFSVDASVAKVTADNKFKGKYPITLEERYYNNTQYSDTLNETGVFRTLANAKSLMVDYYTEHTSGAMQIDITPDKFGGTFYLEASTLWRDQGTGKDLPAEFIIPSCKVQSNFSFTLASSGDPSSFTFTMDAFPDYTRWNRNEKVLASIQVIGSTEEAEAEIYRSETWSMDTESGGLVVDTERPQANPKVTKP